MYSLGQYMQKGTVWHGSNSCSVLNCYKSLLRFSDLLSNPNCCRVQVNMLVYLQKLSKEYKDTINQK
jgi:hypothetical protein